MTEQESIKLKEINDLYSRFWIPIQWCYELLYQARLENKILSDFILEKISNVNY